MEFQTNKETGTQSSNGKYNYAAKLALRYADRSFSSLRGADEILKRVKVRVCSAWGHVYLFEENVKMMKF